MNNKKTKKPNKAELLIYKALNKALEEDKLRLYLDYGKINRPGSPVYDPWEKLLPVLTPVLIGMLLIIFDYIISGLLFITAAILIYMNYFKKKIYHRIIERTKKYITQSYDCCQNLWNFGGIVLVNTKNKKSGCISPNGDWKEFIVQNFADYMIDSQKDETVKNDETETKLSA